MTTLNTVFKTLPKPQKPLNVKLNQMSIDAVCTTRLLAQDFAKKQSAFKNLLQFFINGYR